MSKKTGVLLTNTGTPDAATPKAVRRYLCEFLSDPRIVQIPRPIWLPILYGLVLPLRPRKSAKLYQKIWTANGSPLRVIMQELVTLLRSQHPTLAVEIGMNYGHPSIADGLNNLHDQGVENIIVLPLFPQFSNAATASTFDHAAAVLKKWPSLPHVNFIRDYADHPEYIRAIATSITESWQQHEKAQHLLISFHGIPKRSVTKGDLYQQQCERTAQLLAQTLDLTKDQWTLCYQSQFGYDKWLQPSTQALFQSLPKQGIHHIDVVCPGFAIDCLETLEEIAVTGKETFLQAGGKQFRYLAALNASTSQLNLLTKLLSAHL